MGVIQCLSPAKNGMHNPKSPLLFGEIDSTDVIKKRKVKSLINNQMNLFDI